MIKIPKNLKKFWVCRGYGLFSKSVKIWKKQPEIYIYDSGCTSYRIQGMSEKPLDRLYLICLEYISGSDPWQWTPDPELTEMLGTVVLEGECLEVVVKHKGEGVEVQSIKQVKCKPWMGQRRWS